MFVPGDATAASRLCAALSLVALLLSNAVTPVHAFNFTIDPPYVGACADVQVSWQGGVPPHNLTVIAGNDWPKSFNLFGGNAGVEMEQYNGVWYGRWNLTVQYKPGTQLVMFMSDATGIGTGGSSELITVEDNTQSNEQCWLTKSQPQGLDWMTDTSAGEDGAQSCEPLTISWSDPLTQLQPDLIIGVTNSQVLQFPVGSSSSREIVWHVDVAAGSRVILQGYDATWGNGPIGRASLWTNITGNANGDNSCVDNSSLTATGIDGGATATGSDVPMRTVTATLVVSPGAGLGAGRIAGLVIGVIAALLLAQVAFYFLCWKRRIRRAENRGGRGKRGEKDARRLSRIMTTSDMEHLRYEPFPSTVNLECPSGTMSSPTSTTLGPAVRHERGPFDDAHDAGTDAEVMSAMAEFDKASVRSMPMTEMSAHDVAETSHTGTWQSGTGSTAFTPTSTTPYAVTPTRGSPLDPFGDAMATTWTLAELDHEAGSTATKGSGTIPPRPRPARLATARLREARPGANAPSPIYIHEDAGRIQRAQDGDAQETEELPPRYDPDWRYESER